ncbi:lipopolysaccharide biosynthesis protein [Thiohalocapsa halophila]|nr:oligosaccharide flippase family protein [Thiohalocapsa halophila]
MRRKPPRSTLHTIAQRISHGDADFREILRSGALAFGVKAISAVSAFAMTVVVSRELGATEAGLFFLGLTIVIVVAAITRLGLDNTLVRFIASYNIAGTHGEIRRLLVIALLWASAASILAAIVIAALADPIANRLFNKPEFGSVLRTFAPGIPLLATFTLFAKALQGVKRVPQSLVVLNVTLPLILLALVYLTSPALASDAAVLYLAAAATSLALGLFWWTTLAPTGTPSGAIDKKRLIDSCLPLLVIVLLNQIITWSSQLLLGAWARPADVALFNAAMRTAMLTSFVLIAVNSIAAPKFAELYSSGELQRLRRTAVATARMTSGVALFPLAVMLLVPGPLLSLFGPEFPDAADALRILAVGQFINVATGSVGFLLSMTGHERVLRNNVALAAFIALLAGVALVPPYGLTGAATATALGIATQNLLSLWQVKRLLGFSTLRTSP